MGEFHNFRVPADRRNPERQRGSDFQAALLGMAGHDLRQPLQVIQQSYEWLSARIDTTPERMRVQRGERAIAQLTDQLDRLVGALHLYEHTRSVEVCPVPLFPLLAEISRESGDAAIEKNIDLRVCPANGWVMSHAVLLDGIVRNLVRNSVKYTMPGGRILIGCRRQGPDLRIDIYDTGIGMAPEHLPRIFEAFQRLDPTRADGLGIGLFVVRRAVAALGHRIEVSSMPSRGSRFSIIARAAL